MKKYIILVLFMSIFQFGNSQNINTSLAAAINSKFAPLEKNRIPNHILLDYGFDLIDVTQFDGVLRSNNYLDLERYNQIYNTMVSSATQLNINGIESPQQELTEWKNLQKQQNAITKLNNKASIVLSGLLFNYAKINANALGNNKINALSNNKIRVVNDKYYDKYINGVWQNPYDNKLSFAIASPVFAISKSNVEVTLPTTLWHTNANITAIAIDFGNSTGYKNLTNGSLAATNYTATGVYTWTYRIQLNNGQYKYCRQKVKVTEVDTTAQARNSACGLPQIVSITATKAYQGVFGSATLQIAYGSANCTLQNPLIVAEGLDTGLMAQGGSIGDSDILSFFTSIDNSNSLDLRNLITNNTAVDYDIIYVNWDNGTDFIQRNAFVLEAVIDWVNANKTGTAQNVVLGQSMGGLIARYALKDMEDNAENHDTSLYISHDAPHQGAHIPLGLLHMGRHIVNEFIQTPLGDISIPINGSGSFGLATIDDLLDAPAINQMLINNVDTNGNRTNTTHTDWQTELQAMGYPQQTRNIALSNASHCGNGQGLSSNQGLVTVTGEGGTSVLTSIIELLFINIDPLVGIALNDTSAALLGFLPGNSSLDLEFRANAFPSSGIARIYKGRLTYEKTFLWLIPITRTIFNKSVNSQYSDKFIDNFPGGVSPNGFEISNGNGTNNIFFNYQFNIDINTNFDFIPVTSALDVGSGTTVLNDADYFRTYTAANPPTGSKSIPFVNFTTSSNQNNYLNTAHISFNKRNGDWLAEELDNDTIVDVFDCTAFCSNSELIGEDALCGTGTYSLVGNVNANWYISSGNSLVNIIDNGNSVTLTQTSSSQSGFITLNAYVSSFDCGSKTITKQIWVGKLNVYVQLENNPNLYDTAIFHLKGVGSTINQQGITSIIWEKVPPINYGLFFLVQDNDTSGQGRGPGNNWSFNAKVTVTNSCGSFEYFFVVTPPPAQPCGNTFKIVSNPMKVGVSTNRIIIDPCNQNEFKSANKKYTIEIYNKFGNKVFEKTQQDTVFLITNLKKGFYVVKFINQNGKLISKKLIVN